MAVNQGEPLSLGDRHTFVGCVVAGASGGLLFWSGASLLQRGKTTGTSNGTLRLVMTPQQRRSNANLAFRATLTWLAIGVEACLLLSHGDLRGRVLATLAALLPLYLGMQAVVLLHELGHLGCATLLGFDLQKLQVGAGPLLCKVRCGGLWIEWRAWLVGGFVLTTDEREAGWRWRHWVYVAGGPSATLACCLALGWWIVHPPARVSWLNSGYGTANAVAIYLCGYTTLMLVRCLWPRQGRVGMMLAHTDGYQLLHTPRFTPEKVRGTIMVTVLRRVDLLWEDGQREVAWDRLRELFARFPGAHGLAGSEGGFLYKQGDYAAAAASYRRGLQTEGLLEPGRIILAVNRFAALLQAGEPEGARQCAVEALNAVSSARRVALLDELATRVLVLDRPDFLPDADGWSQEALGSNPTGSPSRARAARS